MIAEPTLDDMWREVLYAHGGHRRLGSRGPLANGGPGGCLYVRQDDPPKICAVMATSPREAWEALGDDLVARREEAIWVSGTTTRLRDTSPLLHQPRSAIGQGRPYRVRCDTDWGKIPNRAGIYRIYFVERDENYSVYVGKSVDLKRRPRYHEKTRGLPWGTVGGVAHIDLLLTIGGGMGAIWTDDDLNEAEAHHIKKMISRYGRERVHNKTVGKNGNTGSHKPTRCVWEPAPTRVEELEMLEYGE